MNGSILIVDDEKKMLEYVKIHLEDYGYHVIISTNGTKALQVVRQTTDLLLVVADMQMPPYDWGGLWLVEQLKKHDSSLPIIILSERGTITKAVEAIKSGANNYVEKSNLEADLVPCIEEILLEKATLQKKSMLEVTTYYAALHHSIGDAWMVLDENSRKFLANGEHIYHSHSHDIHFDFSSAVIEFAKSIEYELNRLYITGLKKWLSEKNVASLRIRLLNGREVPLEECTEKLTIGQIAFVFKNPISKDYCLQSGLAPLDISRLGSFIDDLRGKYQRNEAAHAKFINRKAFELMRNAILGIGSYSPFSYLATLYKGR